MKNPIIEYPGLAQEINNKKYEYYIEGKYKFNKDIETIIKYYDFFEGKENVNKKIEQFKLKKAYEELTEAQKQLLDKIPKEEYDLYKKHLYFYAQLNKFKNKFEDYDQTKVKKALDNEDEKEIKNILIQCDVDQSYIEKYTNVILLFESFIQNTPI